VIFRLRILFILAWQINLCQVPKGDGNIKDSKMMKLSLMCFVILFLTSCGFTKVQTEEAKAGNCLNKAHSVTPHEYFNDFYNTSMNSAWDNSWYKLYETIDFI
jgi:hypothetical protein